MLFAVVTVSFVRFSLCLYFSQVFLLSVIFLYMYIYIIYIYIYMYYIYIIYILNIYWLYILNMYIYIWYIYYIYMYIIYIIYTYIHILVHMLLCSRIYPNKRKFWLHTAETGQCRRTPQLEAQWCHSLLFWCMISSCKIQSHCYYSLG